MRPAAAAQSETPKAAPSALPTSSAPSTPAPAYTGGIFNLGAPAEQKSRNLDYLLEDDEPRSHKGLLLFFVALVLVVGLGYLRFRQTGIPGFLPSTKTTPAAAPNSSPAPESQQPESAPTTTVTAPPPSPSDQAQSSITPVGGAAPTATSTPAVNAANPPATSAPTATDPASVNPVPANSAAAPDSGSAPPAASQPANTQDKSAEAAADKTPAKPETTPTKPAAQEIAPSNDTEEASAPPDVPAKPPKKASKPPAAKPDDPVATGEKYLYGRGVPQSCEKGLRYVKPAAEQSNPKAMITMGALYATGHCLSRDLPTAYRYFALALRKDPENSALKQNAEMVWGQMTPSERQLAIRLTQ